jgi:hypothetical protein
MITQAEFDAALAKYDELEKRGSFYPMFRKLMDAGFELEAYVLVLATWNHAAFRYVLNEFDLHKLEATMQRLRPLISELKGLSILMVAYEDYAFQIQKIYQELAAIGGVKHTGASKLMHLLAPELLVMWDKWIRGKEFKRAASDDYLAFLKEMQVEFRHLLPAEGRTLAKCIDEYNYVKYTIPGLEMERAKEAARKARKKE